MADFCRACTESLAPGYGHKNDFVGINSKQDDKKNIFSMVLCEGCGFIQVDSEGNCVSKDCILAGKPGHGVRLKY